MKLKKIIILFGTVCILNTMVTGCGSGSGSVAETEESQTGEVLSEKLNDTSLKEVDGNAEALQKDTAETAYMKTTEAEENDLESPKPEITQEDGKASLKAEEIPAGDPMAGIVEKYEGNMLTLRTSEDDMLYYFFTENAPILEGYSTESAHEAEGGSTIAVGDKVEISYLGTLDDEEHPTEAVKIVVITGE